MAQFEKEFGYRLPKDYREFLIQRNGANIKGSYCFPIRERWIEEHRESPRFAPPFIWPPVAEVIAEFVGKPTVVKGLSASPVISETDDYDAIVVHDLSYGFADRMPASYLVIGFTTLNEIICLGCAGQCEGQVFLWDACDDPAATAQRELEGLESIATNFQEFWNSLTILD